MLGMIIGTVVWVFESNRKGFGGVFSCLYSMAVGTMMKQRAIVFSSGAKFGDGWRRGWH
jgi:hypothetical protein